MKKTIIFFLTISVILASCKKGEEDSSISLRSRKARLTGNWKVTAYESKTTSSDVNGSSQIIWNHDGTTLNGSFQYPSDSGSFSGTVIEHTYLFHEDGRYEHLYNRNEQSDTNTPVYRRHQETGNWSFLSKSFDSKNKEYLSLKVIETFTESPSQGGTVKTFFTQNNSLGSTLYRLVKLSNSEIIMEQDIEQFSSTEFSSTNSDWYGTNYKKLTLKK